jgi:hypothetical protein
MTTIAERIDSPTKEELTNPWSGKGLLRKIRKLEEDDKESFVKIKQALGLTYDDIATHMDVTDKAVGAWASPAMNGIPENRLNNLKQILEKFYKGEITSDRKNKQRSPKPKSKEKDEFLESSHPWAWYVEQMANLKIDPDISLCQIEGDYETAFKILLKDHLATRDLSRKVLKEIRKRENKK